jgi:hypothetical protein
MIQFNYILSSESSVWKSCITALIDGPQIHNHSRPPPAAPSPGARKRPLGQRRRSSRGSRRSSPPGTRPISQISVGQPVAMSCSAMPSRLASAACQCIKHAAVGRAQGSLAVSTSPAQGPARAPQSDSRRWLQGVLVGAHPGGDAALL